MDIISHGLWGIAINNKKISYLSSFLSGALPDLISSGIGFLYLLIIKNVFWSSTTWPLLPIWIQQLYYFSHSLFGLCVYFLIIISFRWSRLLLLPYLLHILVDIFTHAGSPINRLIFPLEINSSFNLTTNWWDSYWLIGINWLLLITFLFWQYKKTRKIS